MQRILQPNEKLYFSVPIGKERVEFNAQRVFNPQTAIDIFSELEIIDFVIVDINGYLNTIIKLSEFKPRDSGCECGLFVFQRPQHN